MVDSCKSPFEALARLFVIRYYIMPIVKIGIYRIPKYLKFRDIQDGVAPSKKTTVYYGILPVCAFAAELDQAAHDSLVAHADVAATPEDIDQYIGVGAIPQVQNVLEALFIPADWIDTTFTYRQILRMIWGLFVFAGRYRRVYGEALVDNQAQLDLVWADVPVDRRNKVIAIADEQGIDYSAVDGTWTVRRTLKLLADHWQNTEWKLGFTSL